MEKCLIVAVAEGGAIGKKNALLWHLAGDLKYFKRVTSGWPVIMGRTTYFSIGRPLPGRKNIVLNLGGGPIPEVITVNSFEEAYAAAEPAEKCFIMGGASVYRAALPQMDTLYITHVHASDPEADAFFPEIDPAVWEVASRSPLQQDEENGITYEFVVYKRR